MKQTAVEWLVEQMTQGDFIALPKTEWIKQAKEMEKEQIINAIKLTIEKEYYEQTWAHCGSRNHMAEQYYNETFKSE
jgi:transposase